MTQKNSKTDFTLADGTPISFDLSQMTYGQWMGLFDPSESDERSDATVSRVAGLTVEQFKALPFTEYKRLFAALLKKTREPLADPNA